VRRIASHGRTPPGASIEFERPVWLFDRFEAVGNITAYSAADKGRFLFVDEANADAVDRRQLTLVLNWYEQLRRLVPTIR